MIKKGLATTVILLFIGVTFTPSINANVVEDDLVEFDVELCGLGKKHTVKLTQEEADEVELLFDEIHERLNEVETREESKEIFKDAVVELDKYGLLGGLSVRQAQRLVIGTNDNDKISTVSKLFDKSNSVNSNSNNNFLCLLMARTKFSTDLNIFTNIGIQLYLLAFFTAFLAAILNPDTFPLLPYVAYSLLVLSLPFIIYGLFKPVKILNIVLIDCVEESELLSIFSIGLRGIQTGTEGINAFFGFTGIKIYTDVKELDSYYLGCSLAVTYWDY